MNAIRELSEPSVGSLFISSNPLSSSLFSSPEISSDSYATWCMPSPRFSMNFDIGESGEVPSSSSIVDSPILIFTTFTFCPFTYSISDGSLCKSFLNDSAADLRSLTAIPICIIFVIIYNHYAPFSLNNQQYLLTPAGGLSCKQEARLLC